MLRRCLSRLLPLSKIDTSKRVGIFPLHLDPPTNEHLAIFERLLKPNGFAEFEGDAPLDHLVLIPNTRFSVSIQQSVHLASMATLATRHMKNVTVDLSALETPDVHFPQVQQLLERFPKAKLIHWLPDLEEMNLWSGFHDWVERVPLIVLTPSGFGSQGAEYKVKRALSKCAYRSVKLVEVDRLSGAEVRQTLYDNPNSSTMERLIPPPVVQYMRSHGTYCDFRKGHSPYSSSTAFRPTVAFRGGIPRLELLYNPDNLLAREQYEKLKAFEVRPGEQPDLIVPIGGDGYMMQTIRKNWRRFIPFFGVNAGHVGYLLNDCATLEEIFSAPLRLHHMCMLYVRAESDVLEPPQDIDPAELANGNHSLTGHADSRTRVSRTIVRENVAFNDAWIERATGQTALVGIKINGFERIRAVRGDGILVSTAAGSTAYSQALGASPVPVGVPLIQLVGSNVVNPPNWKPVHLNQEDVIDFNVIDGQKRPCRGFVDSVDVGIVNRMCIRTSRVAGVQIAFCDSCDLQKKLYNLQFPKSM